MQITFCWAQNNSYWNMLYHLHAIKTSHSPSRNEAKLKLKKTNDWDRNQSRVKTDTYTNQQVCVYTNSLAIDTSVLIERPKVHKAFKNGSWFREVTSEAYGCNRGWKVFSRHCKWTEHIFNFLKGQARSNLLQPLWSHDRQCMLLMQPIRFTIFVLWAHVETCIRFINGSIREHKLLHQQLFRNNTYTKSKFHVCLWHKY